MSSLPDWILLKSSQQKAVAIRSVFELLLAEATAPEKQGSPLIERLTELLFFYLVRELAARLLKDGTSVGRTAEAVGYASQAAFTRAFKKVFNILPSAFQREYKVI